MISADGLSLIGPFNNYDFPNPQPVTWYRSWEQTLNLTQFYLFVPRSPLYGPRIINEFYRHWDQNLVIHTLLGKDKLPFRQRDWPLPQRLPSSTDYRSYESWYQLQLIGKDKLPKNQFDWPLPTPPRYWDVFSSETLLQSTLFTIPLPPFNQLNWPNPYLISWYRDWNQNLVLTHPSGMPFFQDDWPLPGRWPRVTEYRDWSQNLVVIRPSGKPFNQLNWPNPYPISWYQDWSQNLVVIRPSGKPFNQQDWPLPTRREFYRTLEQGLLQSTLAPVIIVSPFNQLHWPVPPGTVWYRTWDQNLVLNIPIPVPPPFTGARKPLFTGSGTFSPNYWPGRS